MAAELGATEAEFRGRPPEGLQAQEPFVGLWSRPAAFDPPTLSDLLVPVSCGPISCGARSTSSPPTTH